MNCDQCEALTINGLYCHELGCPNTHKRYDHEEETWVGRRECFECGGGVDEGAVCCEGEN